jgi:hypothetical protein
LFERSQNLKTGFLVLHAQIEDGGIEGALLDRLDPGLTILANGDLVTQAGQFGPHEFPQVGLIVHEQDP